ncbi:bifunctional DNA primase/polymerase [Salinifilum aidingensis]
MDVTHYFLTRWALHCAQQNWRIFPLRRYAKRPALHGHRSCPATGPCREGHRGWEQRATTDRTVIERCWAHGMFNIGVATGPSGLVVLDCDQPGPDEQDPPEWAGARDGWDVLQTLAATAGEELPETYTVRTPSEGVHVYFQAPHGDGVRSTAGRLGWHVDVRAAGGYVVGPGSLTPGGGYELVDDTPPVPCPEWLLQRLRAAEAGSTGAEDPRPAGAALTITAHSRSGYLRAVLRGECQRVATAPPGEQNVRLFQAAATLGSWIAGGALDETTARRSLHQAMAQVPNTRPEHPWTPREIDRTVDSGFRAGAAHPRRLISDEVGSAVV